MPLPKSYLGVLQAATPEMLAAATHASAQLVLHLVGAQRLSIDDRRTKVSILKELLNALRAEEEVKP